MRLLRNQAKNVLDDTLLLLRITEFEIESLWYIYIACKNTSF